MKTKLWIVVALSLSCATGRPQTPEDQILKGRAALGGRDLDAADAHFARALAIAPGHEEANVLRAVTRLLRLPAQPAGSNFLSRLGVPEAGRNLYDWTALPPRDSERVPLAPDGVDANEVTSFLRGTLLPELAACETHLAQVLGTNFLTFLPRRETKFSSVFVDYGDVQMLRALASFFQYFIYTTHSWNLDLQLTTLRSVCTGPLLSAESVLDEHPDLFTFSSTNDLFRAQTAFAAAVDRYQEASARIRARPPNLLRLFNWDLESAEDEARFRQGLGELKASLNGPVVVTGNTNYSVHLARHFAGQRSPRTFLPEVVGNSIVAGTLPDPTLDGLIGGLTSVEAEWRLAEFIDVLPDILPPPLPDPNEMVLRFNTVTGRVYAVEFSSDLVDWIERTSFFSTGATFLFADPLDPGVVGGFYRLTDLTSAYVHLAGRVVDRCSHAPVPNALVASLDGDVTQTDASGRFFLQTRLPLDGFEEWLDWLDVEFSAPGYEPGFESFYVGDSGIRMSLSPMNTPPPPNDALANAIPLPGLPVDIVGSNCGATLEPGEPNHGFPLSIVSASVWFSWVAPVSGWVVVRPLGEARYHVVSLFTQTAQGALTRVTFGLDEIGFEAEAGRSYWIGISSYGGDEPGRFALRLQAPPFLTLLEPQDGAEVSAERVTFDFDIVDPDEDLDRIEIVANGQLIGVLTNAPWTFVWENAAPEFYCFEITVFDKSGNTAYEFPCLTVRPRNDNFANRTPMVSVATVVVGSSVEATSESGEPIHGDVGNDDSVWWSWRAPTSGPMTLRVETGSWFPGPARLAAPVVVISTGTELNGLSVVASNVLDGEVRSPFTSFSAVAGIEYQIAVAQAWSGEFFLSWVPSLPPSVRVTFPEPDLEYPAEAGFEATVATEDLDGDVCRVDYYLADLEGLELDGVGEFWAGTSTNPPFSLQLGYLPGGEYLLWAEATDNVGLIMASEFVPFVINEPPSFAVQPANLFATVGVDVALRPVVRGSPPISFQWFKDGQPIGDAIDPEYFLFDVQPEDAGAYSVLAANPFGSVLSSNAVLTVVPPPSLAEALDTPGWTWQTGGTSPWRGVAHVTHEGYDSAQSGDIPDDADSWVETTVVGPGMVQFWWKVSSEESFDFMECYVDEVLQPGRISGETEWAPGCVNIPAGVHTVRWRYMKDEIFGEGEDAGWLDEVSLVGPSPSFVRQPSHQTVNAGATVVFVATATGSAPLFYQWRKDGVDLPGATNSTLTLSNVQTQDGGSYSVLARNAFGTALSSGAVLTVIGMHTLNEALDTPDWTWTTGGNAPWLWQDSPSHDGVDAAQSGSLDHLQLSWVETTVVGPGTLTFWWACSSEPSYDGLEFRLDGGLVGARLSGESGWLFRTVLVPAGRHTLRWLYRKDGSFTAGQDRGWLDEVSFAPPGP